MLSSSQTILVAPRVHARLDTTICKYCVIFKLGSRGRTPDGSCPGSPPRAEGRLRRREGNPAQHTASCSAILPTVFTQDGFFSTSDSIALLNDSTHGYKSSSPHTLARFELKTNVFRLRPGPRNLAGT